MITLNHLVRRKPDVSAEAFRDYWLTTHAEERTRLSLALGVRRFTASETMHDDDVNKLLQQLYQTAADSYDFVDQMVISDLEAFKQGLADEETAAALTALHRGEGDYVDYARSDYWFTIDLPQVYTADKYRATSENTLLKGFYVARRHERLTLAEAQLHWNSCHGGMAREFAEMLPYVKYVQGHRIESAVVNGFKASLNTAFENVDRIVGQAEGWIDRRIVPSLQGPEVERMMGMLVQDIALFVESGVSHAFATKEHAMLDRPLFSVGGSIPTLFNAD